MHRRILALDLGEKRIGIAVSDGLNITAQAVEVIKRTSIESVLTRLKALIKEYDVEKIIIGIPVNMDGTKGARARLSEEFGALLKKEIPLSIETIDERLTTAQGERVLLEADVSRKKRKLVLDKMSAQLILQSYLDSLSVSVGEP